MIKSILLTLVLISATQAMYGADSSVVNLNEELWAEIQKGKELWFVEFYGKFYKNLHYFKKNL